MDDFEKEYTGINPVRRIQGRIGADPVMLAPVIKALNTAKAPVLVVSSAVDQLGGWADGIRLAEKLNAKVWGSPSDGMPGFPETHPLFQGVLPSAIKQAGEALAGADVILALGGPVFRYYPFVQGDVIPDGAKLFQITDNPTDNGSAWVGDAFFADPARAAAILSESLDDCLREKPAPRAALSEPAIGEIITPDLLYHTIQKLRPDDSLIAQESLSTLRLLRQRIPTAHSKSFFSMSSGVLGYGLPAGVGAAIAQQTLQSGRKTICILGDGASNYVIQGLWTAAQQRADILFIVLRNGAYNILKSFQELLNTPGIPGLDLPGLDFILLAKGYGVDAERVTGPDRLERALRAGLEATGPFLLEVGIDPTVPPLL